MAALAASLPTSESVIAQALAGTEAVEIANPPEVNGVPVNADAPEVMTKEEIQADTKAEEEKGGEKGDDEVNKEDDPGNDEDEDDEEDEDGDSDDEDEDDVDAQAEAFAKSLGDQLLAQIGAAFGQPSESGVNGAHLTAAQQNDSLVSAIQVVLQHASSDPHLLAIMQHCVVPGYANLLQCLQHVAATGEVSAETAEMLSGLIATIATGSCPPPPPGLFPPGPGSDSRKRKREGEEEPEDGPSRKRVAPSQVQELKAHLFATIAVISHALVLNNAAEGHVTKGAPSRAQAEQILHFAHACAHRAEAEDIDLQELGALVWMLRSLSGITPPQEGGPSIPIAMGADGKAVYPCVHHHCGQTFRHLIDLRMHQEQAHENDRPFRCKRCPASFMRNHDLKRHYNLHEKRTFICRGCNKTYTRRDALKRHKDHPKSDDACRTTEIVELSRSVPPEMQPASGAPVVEASEEQSVTEQAHAVVSQLFSILAAQQPQQYAPAVEHPPLVPAVPTADPVTALSSFGLSAEHTQLLQRAIAMTAESARQQAEREAAEDFESEDGEDSGDEEEEEEEGEEQAAAPVQEE